MWLGCWNRSSKLGWSQYHSQKSLVIKYSCSKRILIPVPTIIGVCWKLCYWRWYTIDTAEKCLGFTLQLVKVAWMTGTLKSWGFNCDTSLLNCRRNPAEAYRIHILPNPLYCYTVFLLFTYFSLCVRVDSIYTVFPILYHCYHIHAGIRKIRLPSDQYWPYDSSSILWNQAS